jgi:hypothetical protein
MLPVPMLGSYDCAAAGTVANAMHAIAKIALIAKCVISALLFCEMTTRAFRDGANSQVDPFRFSRARQHDVTAPRAARSRKRAPGRE